MAALFSIPWNGEGSKRFISVVPIVLIGSLPMKISISRIVMVMEANKFLTEDDFEAALLNGQLIRWDIKKIDYDFNSASVKSRMLLTFTMSLTSEAGSKHQVRTATILKRYLSNTYRLYKRASTISTS